MPASAIGITFESVGFPFFGLVECYHFTLGRFNHHTLELLLIACTAWVYESSACEFAILLSNEKHSVVPDVVVRIALLVADPKLVQPLYASTSNITQNKDSLHQRGFCSLDT